MVKNKTNIKIGVDLDNTLINYDDVFLLGAKELKLIPSKWYGDKIQIKKYLHSKDGGNIQWQNLQGKVYGKLIDHAKLFDGVYRFLWRCRERGLFVDVVSHKTKYGHGDSERIPLRNVAINFLENHNISIGQNNLLNNIYFENSLEDKILRITDNQYDYFVDDLPEVLKNKNLPNNLCRIIFGNNECDLTDGIENFFSWIEIENRLLGEWTESELISIANTTTTKNVVKANWLKNGGNSAILNVLTEDKERYVLKFYSHNNIHKRLNSEYDSFRLIREFCSENVPLPLHKDCNLNIATYEWISGSKIKKINKKHIERALDFIQSLHKFSKLPNFLNFQDASAVFSSGFEFEKQLHLRFRTLNQFAPLYPELNNYLNDKLRPIMDTVILWSRNEWSIEPSYSEFLPRLKQTLSPSDFGFHNAIEKKNGVCVFIDFEYFGWDDPVKLISDFCFHPGMEISPELKQQWVSGAIKIYGKEILERLRLAWPLIGLSWCLILLNEYRDDIWSRRCIANNNKLNRREEILTNQLKRSSQLLDKIAKSYTEPLFF